MPSPSDDTTGRVAPTLRASRGAALLSARTTALGAWTVGLGQVSLLHDRLGREADQLERRQQYVSLWARGLLSVFGVDQRWVDRGPETRRRARLVVANHRSPLDIILMLARFRGSVLGRHDLEQWPLLGWAARHGGTIFVDRQDPRSGVKAIREIHKRLAASQTVIVFPEGTTHRGDEVRPFQGGAFSAVRGLDVELLPVGIAYDPGAEFVDESFGQHLARMAQRPSTRVALCVGEPRPAEGHRDQMAASLREATQTLVERARHALTKSG